MGTFEFDIDDFIAHRNEREFTFPLHASSIGRRGIYKIKCRRLNLMDRASIGFIPEHLQDDVWRQLRAAARDVNKMIEQGIEPKNVNEALANNDKHLALADIFCEYGWIEPRVTTDPRREVLSGENRIVRVERFAPEDRIAYMHACNDADSADARHFRTFRDEAGDDVPDRQGGEVLGQAPERSAGNSPAPIYFEPPVHDR